MRRTAIASSLIVMAGALLISLVSDVGAQWGHDGTVVSSFTGAQTRTRIVSDGEGGAIIVWEDLRNGDSDIYTQRMDMWGRSLWLAHGVAICTASGAQQYPEVVPDGTGGAIIVWDDGRNGDKDIYSQRVDASGAVLWVADGESLCTAADDQSGPEMATDGAGGAIVTWEDNRSGDYDIYAQRVASSGSVDWIPNGRAICTATGGQYSPQIVSDGAGGAIVTWEDGRTGDYDIYAQRVSSQSSTMWTGDGEPLCTVTGWQGNSSIIPDGSHGAIVAWQDERAGVGDWIVYIQRVDDSGVVQWTSDGKSISSAAGHQITPLMISDDAGGAIITWRNVQSGARDVYVQRVSVSGGAVWATEGVPLCEAQDDQDWCSIASDGVGGPLSHGRICETRLVPRRTYMRNGSRDKGTGVIQPPP
jgi:hypothetical protein